MKSVEVWILIIFTIIVQGSCSFPYTPPAPDDEEVLLIEGLITDQPGVNTVKIINTLSIWRTQNPRSLDKCKVWLTDNYGNVDSLKESFAGIFVTDSASFRGIVGREYTLHVKSGPSNRNLTYESFPMEMKPVPAIKNLYYEKVNTFNSPVEGCRIFLDTDDQEGDICNYYRWAFSETWEFELPFNVLNKKCWKYQDSKDILVKNTSVFKDKNIIKHPLYYISNPIDRLNIKYSILVNQYSLNADEYLYWDRLRNTLAQTGGLYDIIPGSIPTNIYCVEKPDEKLVGYFSVSAVKSKRLFIEDHFAGFNVNKCHADTIPAEDISKLSGVSYWIVEDHSRESNPYYIVTYGSECIDCTSAGTNKKPAFWDDNNN